MPSQQKFAVEFESSKAFSECCENFLSFKIKEEINKRCNCSAIEFPYAKEDLPFCMRLPDFVNDGKCVYEDMEEDWESGKDNLELLACQKQIDEAKNHLICKYKVMKLFQVSGLD